MLHEFPPKIDSHQTLCMRVCVCVLYREFSDLVSIKHLSVDAILVHQIIHHDKIKMTCVKTLVGETDWKEAERAAVEGGECNDTEATKQAGVK